METHFDRLAKKHGSEVQLDSEQSGREVRTKLLRLSSWILQTDSMRISTTPLHPRPLAALAWLGCILGCISGCDSKQQAGSPSQSPVPTVAANEGQAREQKDASSLDRDSSSRAASSDEGDRRSSQPPGLPSPAVTAERANVASVEESLKEIQALARSGQMDQANLEVDKALASYPGNVGLLQIGADVKHASGDVPGAVQLLDELATAAPNLALPINGQAGEWLAEYGDLEAAEKRFLFLLEKAPEFVDIHRWLSKIYNAQGRRWESRKHARMLVLLGNFQRDEVVMQIDLSEPFFESSLVSAASARNAESHFVQLGNVRLDLYKNRFAKSIPILENLVSNRPNEREAWVWLGHSLIGEERWDALHDWFSRKPANAEDHPQYWINVGRWAEHLGEFEQAAEAYCRALELDGLSLPAQYRLAEVMILLNDEPRADLARNRAELLSEIHTNAQSYVRGSGDVNTPFATAEICDQINEPLLGAAFRLLGLAVENETEKMRAVEATIQALKDDVEALSGAKSFLDQFPRDRWKAPFNPAIPNSQIQDNGDNAVQSESQILLAEVTENLGLEAEYRNGADMTRAGMLITQGNGGGVAVIDFDRDGWPDLVHSNAGGKPLDPSSNLPKMVFRNVRGKSLEEVTGSTRLLDQGFGQGVGVGDFNQDGFSDVVIGNFGPDRLFLNQGDGTFAEQEMPQRSNFDQWTTSLTIADVNQDKLPDLVVGRYCAGEESATRECFSPGAESKNCPPNEFPPSPNDIYLSDGRGGFEQLDASTQAAIAEGRTLGVLVTNVDQTYGNDVFMANDVSANFLLLSGENGMREVAARSGVALDSGGRAQACMGIAFADVDHDGLFDLFVTNFLNDLNTLYMQRRAGLFVDGTRRTQLHQFAYDALGFGCQFVDLNNDSWHDLVILNGHIDDYTPLGVPYKMVPQLYVNQDGVFAMDETAACGEYFREQALGRCLVSWDFNRDHRIDFVATHLDRKTAVLANTTRTTNHYVQLELVGTESERDAIGAIVRVTAGENSYVHAVTAGDGYLGANQPLLHFGLGLFADDVKVTVQWPSGSIQEIDALASNQRHLIVEGQSAFPDEYVAESSEPTARR